MHRVREAINYEKYRDIMDPELFSGFLDMDPTKDRKYASWIILWFMKGFGVKDVIASLTNVEEDKKYPLSFGTLMNLNSLGPSTAAARKIVRFVKEDHFKVTSDLEAYDFLKRKHAFKSERDNNIMNVQGFDALADLIGGYSAVQAALEDDEVGPDESEKWHEDDNWLVVVPLTMRAAQKYGANTKWCTAARDPTENAFSNYAPDGPLIIFIDKVGGQKWQVHRESNQWMDERDHEVDRPSFLEELPSEVKETVFKHTMDIWFSDDKLRIVTDLMRDEKAKAIARMEFSPVAVCSALSYGDDIVIPNRIWEYGIDDYYSEQGNTYEDAYAYGYDNPEEFLDDEPSGQAEDGGLEWTEDQRVEAALQSEAAAQSDSVNEVVGELSSSYGRAARKYGETTCQEMVRYVIEDLFQEGTAQEIAQVVVDLMDAIHYDYAIDIVEMINNSLEERKLGVNQGAALEAALPIRERKERNMTKGLNEAKATPSAEAEKDAKILRVAVTRVKDGDLYDALHYVGDDTVKDSVETELKKYLSEDAFKTMIAVFKLCTGMEDEEEIFKGIDAQK